MFLNKHPLLHLLLKLSPWVITIFALYVAFSGVDWSLLFDHLGTANYTWLTLALVLTCFSYLQRARRWQLLFPTQALDYFQSARVLILGFFMNNVLPARAGELVRAHMGAKASGQTRTLVLATVASERLVDGLTISLMFVLFSFHLGDSSVSRNLSYVALLFALVAITVLVTLIFRSSLFSISRKLSDKLNHKASSYALQRFEVFLEGLAPLCSRKSFLILALWSAAIWLTELTVYVAINQAFDASLSLPTAVLFLVAVNFSSLIPAAPGGIGVIEVVTSSILVSVGVPKELALTMVITQHVIQYLVVCIPGALIMLTWKGSLKQIEDEQANTAASQC